MQILQNFKRLLLIFFLISNTCTSSYAQSCQRNTDFTGSAWITQPSGTNFRNGQVIANTQGWVSFSLTEVRKREPKIMHEGRSWNIFSTPYETIDLEKTPGVGIRIKWEKEWVHTDYNFKVENSTTPGTILSQNYSNRTLLSGSAPDGFLITFTYTYEVVVIDNKKYKGGKLILDTDARAFTETYFSYSGSSKIPCIGGTLDLLQALKINIPDPELPDPPTPTCASVKINTTAKLGNVITSQVTDYGSSRSSGTAGEINFELSGRSCPKGTTIKAYFTDIRSTSSTADYLKSSNPDVGIRLYHKQSTTPIQLGPTPIGSTLPARPPVIEGPTTSAGTDMFIPITAQYVSLPGVVSGNIKPSEIKAAATVTFMYD